MLVVMGVAWLVYAPGLTGAFLFDDFANLPALGAFGVVDDWQTFWRYITSGTADPTGRPVSLLTFLLDARDWPADPYPFKRTNLILHLANGVLLFVLLLNLGIIHKGTASRAALAALLGSALWLLHPLFVSTTMYVVQREAMLPGTFMLLGLIGYLRGRSGAVRDRLSGSIVAGGSIVLGTGLAFLSKANGALLPLLVLVLEYTILLNQPLTAGPASRAFVWMRRLLVGVPSVLLLGYLVKVGWNGFVHGTPVHRPWTLSERLLTEGRILLEYLRLLWLPQPYTTGLFNDGIEVSSGILRPWTTLPAIIAIGGLLAAAWRFRRRWPAAAAAVLFFFVAHLLESTVVTLELYYEHRNYIPAMLMFWPLALWLVAPVSNTRAAPEMGRSAASLSSLRRALVIVLPLALALLTWMRADLWGNRDDQAALWALQNPESSRAQAYAAQIEIARGDYSTAVARLAPMLENRPDDLQVALNLIGAKCAAGTLTSDDLRATEEALRTTRQFQRMGYQWFVRAIRSLDSPECGPLNTAAIGALLRAAKENPHAARVRGRRQDLYAIEARLALHNGASRSALQLFNAALDEDPKPGAALAHAALLAQSGAPALGLEHIDHLQHIYSPPSFPPSNMGEVHEWLLERQGYWSTEITHLRKVLASDVAAASE